MLPWNGQISWTYFNEYIWSHFKAINDSNRKFNKLSHDMVFCENLGAQEDDPLAEKHVNGVELLDSRHPRSPGDRTTASRQRDGSDWLVRFSSESEAIGGEEEATREEKGEAELRRGRRRRSRRFPFSARRGRPRVGAWGGGTGWVTTV